MTRPLHKGRGLNKYPLSRAELEAQAERLEVLEQARANASTVEVDGRRWTVLKLPDAYGADYPVEVSEE